MVHTPKHNQDHQSSADKSQDASLNHGEGNKHEAFAPSDQLEEAQKHAREGLDALSNELGNKVDSGLHDGLNEMKENVDTGNEGETRLFEAGSLNPEAHEGGHDGESEASRPKSDNSVAGSLKPDSPVPPSTTFMGQFRSVGQSLLTEITAFSPQNLRAEFVGTRDDFTNVKRAVFEEAA